VKAREIAEAGQTFEYIYGVWQRRHYGDAPLGKALLYSLGYQSDPARFSGLEIWEHHPVRKEGDRRS